MREDLLISSDIARFRCDVQVKAEGGGCSSPRASLAGTLRPCQRTFPLREGPKQRVGGAPGVLPGGCPCPCPQSTAGGGSGQRPGSVWAAGARARARRGARGCWAAVLGGVGGVSEPRLPAQSRARRSPAALCCCLPGQARSSVPPASVDAAPCPRWAQQPWPSTAMTACLRRPSFSSRSSCSPDTDDQGAREDDSIWERVSKSTDVELLIILP
ncbi:uncharacterized protein [Equus asinus]|uniref:uncharacterized protein n=1 Tax=Equus asinus TaxID=9793 RepID=UPI0038F6D1E8